MISLVHHVFRTLQLIQIKTISFCLTALDKNSVRQPILQFHMVTLYAAILALESTSGAIQETFVALECNFCS